MTDGRFFVKSLDVSATRELPTFGSSDPISRSRTATTYDVTVRLECNGDFLEQLMASMRGDVDRPIEGPALPPAAKALPQGVIDGELLDDED